MAGSPSRYGPYCSYDHAWFAAAKTFNYVAELVDLRFPLCENGPAFTERVNLAAAHIALGDHAGAETALSCGPPLQIVPDKWEDLHDPYRFVVLEALVTGSTGMIRPWVNAGPYYAKNDGLEDPFTWWWWGSAGGKWHHLVTDGLKVGCGTSREFSSLNGAALNKAVLAELGIDCTDIDPERIIAVMPWPESHSIDGAKISKCGIIPAFGFMSVIPALAAARSPAEATPGYPDELRADLSSKLAREKDLDNALHIASGIVNPNLRAESLTELALVRIKLGKVREARATLVGAVAAAEDIPEDFPAPDLGFAWSDPKDSLNLQDRAIRLAGIAQVLAEMLPYE